MANIQSQSQRAVNKSKNFFLPDLSTSVLYLLVSAIILAIYNSDRIINWVGINDYPDSVTSLQAFSDSFNKTLSTAFGGRIGAIMVWSLIGAVTYIIIWLGNSLLNSFENDIIIDHYRHPAGFDRAGYWSSTLAGVIFLAVTTIILIAYSFFCLKVLFPGAAGFAGNLIVHFKLPRSLIYITLCLLLTWLAIYAWTRIARVLINLWRLL
jgi:hypothetical protein